MLNRLRNFIRKAFTLVILVEGDKDARRGRQQHRRQVVITPSERFVWGMIALIITLIGAITLEGIYIVVTGRLSTELIAIISGLVGSFTTAFLLGPKEK